ncbi:MAG: transcriptional regulator [Mesorhizobium amorphae]|nr:MAG: transcriptional regulator [Mesorhizobium amorphae]
MAKSRKPQGGSPTLADVAARARVSRAAVSRALSPEHRPLSADKRERVLKAAEELGYRPNLLAQSLTTKRTNLVAVVVNHIHDLSDLDLFDQLLTALQGVGKQVLLIKVGSVDRVEAFLRDGVAHHVDAALVWSDFADAATVRRMFRSDFAVMMNGRHDALSPAVIPDESTGIRACVRDAAEKGVRRALLVSGRASSAVEQARVASFREAFAASGIGLEGVIQGDYSYASGQRAGAELRERDGVDGVFCTSDAMAMGVLDACRAWFPENRPARFRLYGFDDLSFLETEAYPISSVGFDKGELVREITKLVVNPEAFVPGQPPATVPTRFFPRLTG